MIQTLELADKGLEKTTVTMLKGVKEDILVMNKKLVNLSREKELAICFH